MSYPCKDRKKALSNCIGLYTTVLSGTLLGDWTEGAEQAMRNLMIDNVDFDYDSPSLPYSWWEKARHGDVVKMPVACVRFWCCRYNTAILSDMRMTAVCCLECFVHRLGECLRLDVLFILHDRESFREKGTLGGAGLRCRTAHALDGPVPCVRLSWIARCVSRTLDCQQGYDEYTVTCKTPFPVSSRETIGFCTYQALPHQRVCDRKVQ